VLPSRIRTSTVALFLATVAIVATGYLRELVLASLFGAGAEMDAFYFSLALVLALHDLVFAGVLGATIVPLLHSDSTEPTAGPIGRDGPVITATLVVAVIGALLAAALCALMPFLIPAIAPGMSEPVRALSIEFTTILIWSLPAGALTTLFTLVLNAHHRFALPALVYVANNLLFVILLLSLASQLGAHALPIVALAGSMLTAAALAIHLARLGLLRRIRPDPNRAFFAAAWSLSRPLLLSFGLGSTGGLLMASQLVIRTFAADHGEGAIAALGYAFRLYQVPLSLTAHPAASLMLPLVAAFYAARRLGDVATLCRQALLWGLVLLFPAAIVLWGGADLVVHVLLQRGNFDAEAAHLTAEALRGFAPAVILEASIVVFFRVFYALRMPDRTVLVAFVTLLSLILAFVLFPKAPFAMVAVFLSASFGVATALLLTLLISFLGRTALPAPEQLVRWSACAAVAIAAWKIVTWNAASATSAQAIGLTAFICVYLLAVGVLLPDCRRMAAEIGRETAARTAWWRP
jgi:putative peptidoglycan lipid II flippase